MEAHAYGSMPQDSATFGTMPDYLSSFADSYNTLVGSVVAAVTGESVDAARLKEIRKNLIRNEQEVMIISVADKFAKKMPFLAYFTEMRGMDGKRIYALEEKDDNSDEIAAMKEFNDPMTHVTPELLDSCITDMKTCEFYRAADLLAKKKNELFR